MKLISLALLLFFFLHSFSGQSQSKDTLGFKRFYWGIVPGVLISTFNGPQGRTALESLGVPFEVGNYWNIYSQKRTSAFVRFTWVRTGLFFIGILVAPAHVGLGFHVDYGPKLSIDYSANTGVVMGSDWEFIPVVYPRITFNLNRFSLGLEYTYKKQDGRIDFSNGFHYFGVSLGGRFGKRIN